MDGSAALAEIKKSYSHIKVVMLTMNDSKQTILEMLKLGADGYLTKNDDCEEIYNAIVTCKNEGQYMTKKNSDVLLQSIRDTQFIPVIQKDQIKTKKFSVKNVLLYSLITTLITGLVIFVLYQLKENMILIKNIESPITYINN